MIMLTGGAGFIGSCFLKKLNDENITDILVVDHLNTGRKWKNLIGKKFDKYIDKYRFRENLKNGVYGKSVDAIIHLGACSVTTENDADYMMDNNFTYSTELAEFAVFNNIRFIYASSAATYGSGDNGYSDYEFDNLVPLNVYGYSKHLFDLWVIKNGYDNLFAGLKYFNVFGPNEYHKGDMASVVYKSYNYLKEHGKIRLFRSNSTEYADGGQKRDFIYIKDVCNVMWQIFQNDKIKGIFNLGTGKAHTWNDLANNVFEALKLKPEIEYFDMPENLKKQYQNFTEADMNKLKAAGIDYKFIDFKASISDYVNNYLSKENQYF